MSLARNFQKNRIMVVGILFVFAVIELLSSLWLMHIMDGKLLQNAAEILRTAEANIKTSMSEPESTLVSAVQSVRYLSESNASADTVREYLEGLGDWLLANANRVSGFNGIYGVVKGKYVDGMRWTPPADFNPQLRPWHMAAMGAPGEIAQTRPYVDAQTGETVISLATQVLGSDGKALIGVVSIDVLLTRVKELVKSMKLADGGYGVLVNADGLIISHLNDEYVGTDYARIVPDFEKVRRKIAAGKSVADIQFMDSDSGGKCVGVYYRLFNGWYVGLITPLSSYFGETYRMIATLVAAFSIAAVFLCFFVLRLSTKPVLAEQKIIRRNFYLLSGMLLVAAFLAQTIPFYFNATSSATLVEQAKTQMAQHDNRTILNEINALSSVIKSYLKDYEDTVDSFMYHAALAFQVYDRYAQPTREEAKKFAEMTRVTEFEVFKKNGDILYATGNQHIEEDSFNLVTNVWEGYQGILDGTATEIPTTLKIRIETGEIFKFTAVPRLDPEGNITGIIESCHSIEDLQPNIESFVNNYGYIRSLHLLTADDKGVVLISVENEKASVRHRRGTHVDTSRIITKTREHGYFHEKKDGSILYYSQVWRSGVGSAYILMLELDEGYYTNATNTLGTVIDEIYDQLTWQSITLIVTCIIVILLIIAAYTINMNRVVFKHFVDLSEQTRLAETANAAKSRFLAVMSHEIRTPLNAIIGISELQILRGDLSGEANEAMSKINSSGNGLLNIINDILDLSKIETGKLEIVAAEYDVPSLLNDTVQLNIVRIRGKAIEFILDADENLPSRLLGDELHIKQILNNILSNAFKYTTRGSVRMAVSHTRDENGITLAFEVRDTGQGMKPEDLERLFSDYSRFNLNANRTTEGTGLGMSITKKLIELMGGRIAVQSEYGKGSTFTAKVRQKLVEGSQPIGPEVAAQLHDFTFSYEKPTTAPRIDYDRLASGTVLIVDDLETNLYVASGYMKPYGLAIETATSGFEAIDKIKAGKIYDIIFLDHMMPEMDGIETIEKIRALGYAEPIVALTANALVGNEEKFKAVGFDAFMPKPMDAQLLDTILATYIRGGRKEKSPPAPVESAGAAEPGTNDKPGVNGKLLEIFHRDARKAAETLYRTLASGDMKLFTITAHAMKSACANVGETALSELAKALETAGTNGDASFIAANAPRLIEQLRAFVAEIQEGEGDEEEDAAFSREKLLSIKAACENYDEPAAAAALAELKAGKLRRTTRETLERIEEQMLHSDFEEAAETVEKHLSRG